MLAPLKRCGAQAVSHGALLAAVEEGDREERHQLRVKVDLHATQSALVKMKALLILTK